MRSGRRPVRALLLVTGALALVVPLLATTDVDLPGRTLLAVAFALLVPGAPVPVLLGLPDTRVAVALGLAASLSAQLLVATLLLITGVWDPLTAAWLMAGTGLLLLAPAWHATRDPAALPVEAPHAPEAGGSLAAPPAHDVLPLEAPRLGPAVAAWLGAAAPRLVPLAVLALALELWTYAVLTVDLDDMDARGLISVVGWPYALAILLVAAVAAWGLRRSDPDPVVMAASATALVVVLFGFANLADDAPGFRTAWVHVGFIEHITRYGEAATGFDARFSWPGFFAAAAVVVRLAGLPDAEALIRWAPVVYNLLALPALLVIGRVLTGSRRAAWLGVLLYSCFNWFSQDYLSPQATVLLLYVAVIATLLTVAVPPAAVEGPLLRRLWAQARSLPARPDWLTPRRSVAVEGVLGLVCLAAVVTHQLTPVTLIGILFAFALSGATRYRQLWLLMALAFLAWFSYGAEDFWRGHLSYVIGDVGKLGSTLGSSVGERLQGNEVHGQMQQVRLLWSAGSLGLAAIALWLRRGSPWVLLFAALAFGPFGLLAVQSYGGEVALRCFVYAQPAVAPLAAYTVLRVLDLLPRAALLRPVALTAVVTAAALVLTAARGTNLGFERVTRSQVEVARILLDAMPKDSRIGLLADAGPLGVMRLTEFDSVSLAPDVCGTEIVQCVRRQRPDYLYVTSTMDVLGQLQFGEPPGWVEDVVDELVRLKLYRRLAARPDAYVLGRVEPRP